MSFAGCARWVSGLFRPNYASQKPVLLRFRSSEAFILAVVSMAWFTDMFIYGIVWPLINPLQIVPVLPMALTSRLGIQPEDRQYWTSVLLAVFGVSQLFCSLLFGYLSDRFRSRKSFMYIGLLSLGLSTILLCVGRSIGVFIVGRMLQGASAAMVGSVGLAIVVDTVPPHQIGRAMGTITIFTGLALVLSPVLGGLAYEKSGYISVFAMAFGFIGLDFILRFFMIERHEALRWESDNPQSLELELQNAPLEEDGRGASPNATATDEVEQTVDVPTFTTEEARPPRKATMPAIQLLGSPRFLAALWGTCVLAALMTAFDSTIPIYTNRLFGFSSLGGGATIFALLSPSLLGPIAGILSDKYGARWLATGGFVGTVPFLVLLRLVEHHSLRQIVLLCVLLVLVGIAITVAMAPLMSEIALSGIELDAARAAGSEEGRPNAFAQAFGVAGCAFAAGTVVGPIWGGLVLTHSGWATMTWSISLLPILAAVTSSRFVSNTVQKEE